MAQLFADYRPTDRGTPIAVDVRPLERRDIDECTALAVERNGGVPATWHGSFERSLSRADQQTFVASHDGRVVGYGTTAWMDLSTQDGARNVPDGWYLTGVVVAPAYRRRGVGRLLTEERLRWLGPRTDSVWYFATAMNKSSLDLHTALGFQEVTRDFAVPGVTFTGGEGVLSVKDLTGPR